jgi:heme/copper-type cytochrome/quinol oxidase subunit 1
MGAWSLWYRNLYYALRYVSIRLSIVCLFVNPDFLPFANSDDSSFQRARHLFWFFGHFVFCVVMALGVPNWAAGCVY